MSLCTEPEAGNVNAEKCVTCEAMKMDTDAEISIRVRNTVFHMCQNCVDGVIMLGIDCAIPHFRGWYEKKIGHIDDEGIL